MRRLPWMLLALLVLGALAGIRPTDAEPTPPRATVMARAAAAWLAVLSPAQRKQAVLPWNHPSRIRWQATPGQRTGLAWGALKQGQRPAADTLLRAGLSELGVTRFRGVVMLEGILRTQAESRGWIPSGWRNPGLYWIAVYGDPKPNGIWSWRVEGHHFSRHFTCVRGRVSCTPGFHGANPAQVAAGPRRGKRVLAAEEDGGRALVQGLDAERRARALLRSRPNDFLPSTPRDLSRLKPQGLPFAQMTEAQRALVWRLLGAYAASLHPDLAKQVLERARATTPGKIHFAWRGPLTPGRSHGYVLHGPTVFIEYWHGGNHIHAVWRDPQNEYGRADLAAALAAPR